MLIKARVRAVPEKGKANRALIKLMAEWLGVAKSDVTLMNGDTSRQKRLFISGDTQELDSSLQLLLKKFEG